MLSPPYRSSDETGSDEGSFEPADRIGCDAPEVLQSAEGVFDVPSFFVETLVETVAAVAASQPASKRPPDITVPSSLSQPSCMDAISVQTI